MKANKRALLSAIVIILVLVIPTPAWGQHKHAKSGTQKAGMTAEMSKMMKSPHHMLMTAHMKSMTDFATILRDQAVKPTALDIEFARAAVAELRHDLDAMEAIHQSHMQAMSVEMQSKMKMMMEKMGKGRSMVKDQVSALETDVQTDTTDSKQVADHANALLKQLGMMSEMMGGTKAAKKMGMKKKMEMKM